MRHLCAAFFCLALSAGGAMAINERILDPAKLFQIICLETGPKFESGMKYAASISKKKIVKGSGATYAIGDLVVSVYPIDTTLGPGLTCGISRENPPGFAAGILIDAMDRVQTTWPSARKIAGGQDDWAHVFVTSKMIDNAIFCLIAILKSNDRDIAWFAVISAAAEANDPKCERLK